MKDKRADVGILILSNNIKLKKTGAGYGYCWVGLDELTIIACYFSPNRAIGDMENQQAEIEKDARGRGPKIIIGGDFNAKSKAWGSIKEDTRGLLLREWIESLDLLVLSEGRKPTFSRGEAESIIDITLGTREAAKGITDWEVPQEENLSDHNNIYMNYSGKNRQERSKRDEKASKETRKGWIFRAGDGDKFTEVLMNELEKDWDKTADGLDKVLEETCEMALKRTGSQEQASVYWWCNEVQEKRIEYNDRGKGRTEESLQQKKKSAQQRNS